MHHEATTEAASESRVDHLREHMRWQPDFAERVIRYAERKGTVRRNSGRLILTQEGRSLAQQAMVR